MNRVVVTGMGVVTPLGNTLSLFRQNLLSGSSGIGPLTLFDPGRLPTAIAGECHLEETTHKDRKISFSLHAAHSAMLDARLHEPEAKPPHNEEHRGLSIGIGLELFDMHDLATYVAAGFNIPASCQGQYDFLQTPADYCVDLLCEDFSLRLNPGIHVSACAAGNDAIGHAFLRIRRGEASLMLAGGTDSMLNPLGVGGFCKLNALSTRNEAPQKASRPFDINRDGFVLGEGAAMLVLENMDLAVQRGADIYAEIVGFGNSFDAHAISDPHPAGRGAVAAMSRAMAMAGISPDDISYINAHGTATPKNDPVETLAIKTLFGRKAYRIPVSSTKSMIGHLISAAGAVEAAAGILCANAGWVHPTINLDNPDPDCDLDYVPGQARQHRVGHFLSNSFAFGGQNATLVFRNWES